MVIILKQFTKKSNGQNSNMMQPTKKRFDILHLLNKNNHVAVLSIAIPMILSNITVPLLGLVDSAVIGHLEHASYLGGVALGGAMINVLLWLFGFLRMATTGIAAQAYGANDKKKQAQILLQGVIIAIMFSLIILTFFKCDVLNPRNAC